MKRPLISRLSQRANDWARLGLFSIFSAFYYSFQKAGRRVTISGVYLTAMALASLMLIADPFRIGSRHLLSICVAAILLGLFSSFFRPHRKTFFNRDLPQRVFENQPFSYRVQIQNRSFFSIDAMAISDETKARWPTLWQYRNIPWINEKTINIFDRIVGYPKWDWLCKTLRDAKPAVFQTPPLAPGENAEFTLSSVCNTRGERFFMGFYCAMDDAFCSERFLAFFPKRQSLIVWPAPIAPAPVPSYFGKGPLQGENKGSNRTDEGEELRGLREWRAGESSRLIHWRATAKAQKPIAKELSPLSSRRGAIFVDTRLGGLPLETLHCALRSTAGFLMQNPDERPEALFLPALDPIELAPGMTPAEALDALALAQPQDSMAFEKSSEKIIQSKNQFSFAVIVFCKPRKDLEDLALNLERSGLTVRRVRASWTNQPREVPHCSMDFDAPEAR